MLEGYPGIFGTFEPSSTKWQENQERQGHLGLRGGDKSMPRTAEKTT